ncbi:cytochrome c oxidase subunit II [Paucibacter sp. R3-3]|uniref:Cytochrome aa3 subunit 2 n=1 Tax=Roseateles agri TaxID=3098619 RepID=A0ABU5DRB5_9BURK|nr:cytochrome c oxidase subunit II [Paucibacter sp. R3-3]MDY0747582.1 cytochrome c oxidase subunit II [Paucibacter sp. R3-3]
MSSASMEAQQIAELGRVLFIGSALLFALAMLLLALAVRRPDRKTAVPPAIWIFGLGMALPALVLAALMMFAAQRSRVLAAPPPADALLVGVMGRLWWWDLRYESPAGAVRGANELRLPAGRAVRLTLASEDVIHSFWVPQLGGKMDLVPGRINHLTITASTPGVYAGACAEFCGQQHARMALKVVVMPAAEFDRWLAAQAMPAALPVGDAERRGRQAFREQGCAACHSVRETLSGTPQGPALGPDLTHLASRLHLGAGLLANERSALRRWIGDVQVLKPGARMPSYAHLDASTLDALSAYLAELR